MDFCWKAVLEGKNPTKVGFLLLLLLLFCVYCIIGESSYNIQSYQKRYGVGKHVVLCKTTEGNVDHLLLLFFFLDR